MRCIACNVILSDNELLTDLGDGSINDLCYVCQAYVNDPDFCVDRDYQLQDITEAPWSNGITQPKSSEATPSSPRRSSNYYV